MKHDHTKKLMRLDSFRSDACKGKPVLFRCRHDENDDDQNSDRCRVYADSGDDVGYFVPNGTVGLVVGGVIDEFRELTISALLDDRVCQVCVRDIEPVA